MGLIERVEYLEWLDVWKEKKLVKVVSGVRRCGKSTLFSMFRDHLKESGVEQSQIIDINFENLDYEHLSDYRALYDYVNARLDPRTTNYVFLDEIQHVEHFEKAVDSLFVKDNVDVYVTGSNAYFMSGELATLLSGRYIELKMLPLSFKEFCAMKENAGLSRNRLFGEYIAKGSFPFVSDFKLDKQQTQAYLRDLYNTQVERSRCGRENGFQIPQRVDGQPGFVFCTPFQFEGEAASCHERKVLRGRHRVAKRPGEGQGQRYWAYLGERRVSGASAPGL